MGLIGAGPAAACDLEMMGYARFNPLASLAASAHSAPVDVADRAGEAVADPAVSDDAVSAPAEVVANPATTDPTTLASAAATFR